MIFARDAPGTISEPMLSMMSGWKISPKTAAMRLDRARTARAGIFLAIIMAVASGTAISHGDRLNRELSTSEYSETIDAWSPVCDRPSTRKITRVIVMEGTVVNSMYRMWVKRGTLHIDEAITVVSDRGEILSPKYAPEIMAPAIIPSEKPSALPMPIRATPMVAIVVHELPVIRDTMAQMMQAVIRNTFGLMILIP